VTRSGALAALLLLLWVPAAHASVEAGQRLYQDKGCAGCHVIDGQGGAVGPDLTLEGTVPGHDHDWHVRHLMDPAAVVPGSIMPKLIQDPAQAEDLADYLTSLGSEAEAAPAPEATPPAPEQAAPAPAAPVEAAPPDPAEPTPAEPAAAEPAPVEQAPVKETPVEAAPVADAPAEQVEAEPAPVEAAPPQEAPAKMVPAQTAPAQKAPAAEAPAPPAEAVSPPARAAPAEPLPPQAAPAEPLPEDPAVTRGRAVYAARGCSGCHKMRGSGGTLGPDLTFEGEVAGHDADWHRRHFADPRSVSPGSAMPAFDLTPAERDDLVAFMLSLKRLERDRTLQPDLARRFAAVGTVLEGLRDRIDRAHRKGRNVDDLNVQLSGAWTHVGTVEEMVRRQDTVNAEDEIAAAEATARSLAGVLDAFDWQLRERLYAAVGVIALILFGCWIFLRKIRLLVREWDAEEGAREAARSRGRRGPPLPPTPEGDA
jgi:cbb3-type cytochrome oxidase cytochrome c subunit